MDHQGRPWTPQFTEEEIKAQRQEDACPVTAQVRDRCSQLALAEEGWAGRDSSRGAQLGLTGQGVLVAAIALAAAHGGPYVAFGAIIEGEES